MFQVFKECKGFKVILLSSTIFSLSSQISFAAESGNITISANDLNLLKSQLDSLKDKIKKLEEKQKKAEANYKKDQEQIRLSAVTAAKQEVAVIKKSVKVIEPTIKVPEGYIWVPNTNSAVKIGGQVKFDAKYDSGASAGNEIDVASFPLKGVNAAASKSSNFGATANASQLSFRTYTPITSSEDTITTFTDIDFSNSTGTGSYSPNLLHAVVEYTNVKKGQNNFLITAGQTESTFEHVETSGETLDYNGPTSGPLRQPQLRYTHFIKPNLTWAVAAERPNTDYTYKDGTLKNNGDLGRSSVPDFTTQVKWTDQQGQIALRALYRQLSVRYITDASTSPQSSQSNFGSNKNAWGLGLSCQLITMGKNNIFAQVNGGDGIGRYIPDLNSQGSYFDETQRRFEVQRAIFTLIGYQHYWTETIRSNIMASYAQTKTSSASPKIPSDNSTNRINKDIKKIFANIIYSPLPSIDAGFEIAHFKRTAIDNSKGIGTRYIGSISYKF